MSTPRICLLPHCRLGGAAAAALYAAEAPPWANAHILGIHELPSHAVRHADPDEPAALAGTPSPLIQSLDGTGTVHWVPHPDQRPHDIWRPDSDGRTWCDLPIPSNGDMHGFGTPIYVNLTYPFANDPPRMMTDPPSSDSAFAERTPVGSYRRSFRLERDPAGREGMLTVRCALPNDTSWAPAGHVGAWDQLPFGGGWSPPPVRSGGRLEVETTPATYLMRGAEFEVRIGRASGVIESWTVQGWPILRAPLVPNDWRAPTDNDRGNQVPQWASVWRDAAAKRTVERCEVARRAADGAEIVALIKLPAGESRARYSYRVNGTGQIEIETRFEPAGAKLPLVPRVGLMTELAPDCTNVAWYGRGPHECYWDRKTGAAVGRYRSTVRELIYNDLKPQDNGHRTDVRWLEITDPSGRGVRVIGLPLFGFNAWPYRQRDLEGPMHPWRIPRRELVTLCLDAARMGVGGDDSWGARTHPEYCIHPGRTLVHRLRIEPVNQ